MERRQAPRLLPLHGPHHKAVASSHLHTHTLCSQILAPAPHTPLMQERFEKLTLELRAEKARSDALVQRMSVLLACFPFKDANTAKTPPGPKQSDAGGSGRSLEGGSQMSSSGGAPSSEIGEGVN